MTRDRFVASGIWKRRDTNPSTALRAERYALRAGWFMARVNACPSGSVADQVEVARGEQVDVRAVPV